MLGFVQVIREGVSNADREIAPRAYCTVLHHGSRQRKRFYGVLYALTEYLGVWYIASAIISCLLYIGLSFALQKFWTFQDNRTEVAGRQLRQYLTMAACFFVGNIVALYLLVQYAQLWYIHAQVIVTVVLSILSYLISGRIFGKE